MRVAYFGNTNNGLYRIAKCVREKGIDAQLYLFENDIWVNDPANEDPALRDGYPDWIHLLPQPKRFELPNKCVIEACQDADVVHVSGAHVSSVWKAKRPYIFHPTGGDLFSLALWPWQRLLPRKEKILQSTIHLPAFRTVRTWFQRCAIRYASAILYGSVSFEHALKCLSTPNRVYYIPLLYPSLPVSGSKTDLVNDGRSLRILHPTRQNWRLGLDVSETYKGNDLLYRAAMRAIQQGVDLKLYIVEYKVNCPDLEASKQLIKDLGLDEWVQWLPQMPVSDLFNWYRKSDIVANQFGLGAIGFISFEALSCGIPVMVKLNEDYYRKMYPELPPVINVSTVDEITKAIIHYAQHRQELRDLGNQSEQWARKYVTSDEVIDRYIRMYEEVVSAN